MSPPLLRCDVRHVGDSEIRISLHGPENDIDSVAARDQIDERSGRTLPAFDFVLPHAIDEIALLVRIELHKPAAAVTGLTRAVDRADRRPIEIGVWRTDIEDARNQQPSSGGMESC
jgi:hypothetical protein